MKIKYMGLIILAGFFSNDSLAQKKPTSVDFSQLIGISWEISIPSGSKQLFSKTSLSGGRIEYRKFFSESFSAGAAVSWNTVEQYFPTKTYEKPGGAVAVTTDMVRQAFTMPITLTAHYYPALPGKILKPYVGVGLGAQYASQDVFYNIYVIDNSDWGFVTRPEIGTLARFNEKVSGIASVSYNYSTNKIDALGISGFNQVNFNIGIAFLMD